MNMQMLMRTAACVVVMMVSVASMAQYDVATKKKEINSIKKNSSYIYGEATMEDRQAAIDLAKEILYKNINEWVDSKKKYSGASNVVTINTNYTVEEMTLPRGNWFRAFMYVNKKDVIPADNVLVSEKNPHNNVQPQNNNVEHTTAEETVQDVTPAEEVHEEQLVVKEEKTVDAVENHGWTEELVQEFLKPQTTGELGFMLKKWKENGSILEFNKWSMLKNLDEYVLFVFSRDKKIVAVLSAGSQRINLKTGKADDWANYKGNGAIGVKVNTNR